MANKIIFLLLLAMQCIFVQKSEAQTFEISSPDGKSILSIDCKDRLSYRITQDGYSYVSDSPMGFELKNEKPLTDSLTLLTTPTIREVNDSWLPVVKYKHAVVANHYNTATLQLRERKGEGRRMDIEVRAYDEGIAFRYHLYGGRKPVDREVTRELTGFNLPAGAYGWVSNYAGRYASSFEGPFVKTLLKEIKPNTVAGMPFLVEIDKSHYMALCEADFDGYPGAYIGREEDGSLFTLLSPLPGEEEDGVKARFTEDLTSAWRIVMMADSPCRFIESELIRNLNEPCELTETSWIKPGMSAWDHWWSGEVKMEMPVIKEYIDLASAEGWPYMLIDWQWYGPYNTPEADITKAAPQLDMPEILRYAREKGVRCWLWLYCTDVNSNDAYKEAFALYEKWGIAGIKIDFMDRNDQQMTAWYRKIIRCAAKHHLMVDFHGAFPSDGIERTLPNMMTREGVMGEEYSKWSRSITPSHNITLAFTRMLAGEMDYTPGGFLNVTPDSFKMGSPAEVMNTRVAELSKFVIYESPFMVYCDHPSHILGQPGADFLATVPTTWDDIRVLGGYPGEYIAVAKRSGNKWYLAVMNNEKARTLMLPIDFLEQAGTHKLTYWQDAKDVALYPTHVSQGTRTIRTGKTISLKLAPSGGFVGIIE